MDSHKKIDELAAVIDSLVDILIAKGTLTHGHKKLFASLRHSARHTADERVRLRVVDDGYEVSSEEIDCAGRLDLCKARCCTFAVSLSVNDLEAEKLKWHIDRPYMLLRDEDGYCHCLDRKNAQCTQYDHRPMPCRAYDCRDDDRVWLDFDKRIAAPMPAGITPP